MTSETTVSQRTAALRGPRRSAPQREMLPGVGARVRAARKQVGMSGADLARFLGLDKTQVSKIENETRRISVREMPQLAQALRVSPQWLLGLKAAPTFSLAHRLSGANEIARAQ